MDAPAAVTAGLHKGDRVLVDLTVIRQPHPDQVARLQPSGQPMLVGHLPAEIVSIQRSVDVVTVRTRAAGRHYRATDHAVHPRPLREPHPPLFIGGKGAPILALAAKEADIVSLTGIAF